MTDTHHTTGGAGQQAASSSGDIQKFITSSLSNLLTPDGLEANLEIGLRMDSQNHIPLQNILMHFYSQGIMTDVNQIKAALKTVPNTSISEDSLKVFVNIPNKKNLLVLSGVTSAKAEALKKHLAKSPAKTSGEDFREKDQAFAVRTVEEADATTLQNWLKTNPVEGLDLKVAVQSESFSAYLKDKYKAKAQQLEKADRDSFGNNPYNFQAQYQAMMQMMMMSMMQNPQQQMMMMQMMNPGMQFGQQAGPNAQKNNLFVRKAKGTKGGEFILSEPKQNKVGVQSARQSNVGRDKQDKKIPLPEKSGAIDEGRGRLDSDSFPPLAGKKTIMSDPKGKPKDLVEGKVTRAYLIEFFRQNKDSIKINEKLAKFNQTDVPIIEREPELRVEEVNPTPKKEYSHKEPGVPSGPNSRKGSMNYRKGSFNKKKGTEDDEYVPRDDK